MSQIYWTEGVNEKISGGPKGLMEYYDKLEEQLGAIVKLVSLVKDHFSELYSRLHPGCSLISHASRHINLFKKTVNIIDRDF